MATRKQMHELIGRAVMDSAFRFQLVTNPVQAGAIAGCQLTEAQANALKAIDIARIGFYLDMEIARSLRGAKGY